MVLILAVIPEWPYSSGWGYYPGGILAVALVLVILLLLVGDLVRRRIPGLDSCYSGITYRNNASMALRPF